jgi:hypothetical protein
MQEKLERVEARSQFMHRRRYEAGQCRRTAAQPVLGAAELSRLLVGAPARIQKLGVHFPDQPQRQGKPCLEPLYPVIERRYVSGNLLHIIQGNTRHFFQFKSSRSDNDD